MGSQTSASRHQTLSDAHQSGLPGLPGGVDYPSPTPGERPATPTVPMPQRGSRLRSGEVGNVPPGSKPAGGGGPSGGGTLSSTSGRGSRPSFSNLDVDERIPCVFTWSHGGHNVYLLGSFNRWNTEEKLKLIRSGHEFSVIYELQRGLHRYKFIVDDQWKYAPEQPTECDHNGNINNVLDVSSYKVSQFEIATDKDLALQSKFNQIIPEPSEYSTDAPTIPFLLSKSTSVAVDTSPAKTSAIPLHCLANHVYHDSYAPGLFGPHISCIVSTQRWRSPTQNYCGQRFATFLFVTINPLHPQPPDPSSPYAVPNPLQGMFVTEDDDR